MKISKNSLKKHFLHMQTTPDDGQWKVQKRPGNSSTNSKQ